MSVGLSGSAKSRGAIGVQQTVEEVFAGFPADRQASGDVSA